MTLCANENIMPMMKNLISCSRASIKILAYTMDHFEGIAMLSKAASERGVVLRIVIDRKCFTEPSSMNQTRQLQELARGSGGKLELRKLKPVHCGEGWYSEKKILRACGAQPFAFRNSTPPSQPASF